MNTFFKRLIFNALPLVFVSITTQGQMAWDLGAAVGTYGGYSYSQVDLGLNWHINDYLNWRNVLFSRFGSSVTQAYGLDSSLRFEYAKAAEADQMGLRLFAGPGVRISSTSNTGYFAEAGVVLKLGGLHVGGGIKALSYANPGRDPVTNDPLPTSDLTYFLILSGAGRL